MAGGGFDERGSITAGRSLRRRSTNRLRGSLGVGGGLMLASMLDILMAILFFLLKNYSSTVSDFTLTKDIRLPYSSATMPPMPALQLVVTQQSILLDNKEIAKVVNGEVDRKALWRDGVSIVPLMQELKKHKDRTLYIQNKNDANSFSGAIVMQADKDLRFSLLKKVIYTAGVSDFVMLKLAVLKSEEGV